MGSRHFRRWWVVFLAMILVACQVPLLDRQKTTPAATAMPTRAAPTATTPATPRAAQGTASVLEAAPPPAPAERSGDQTLTLAGTPEGPATLDPALVRDADSAWIVRQIFRGLVKVNADLQPVPDLAQRIEISGDGLTYTFDLFPDTTFTNGRRITSEDVRYSLERATDPALVGGDGQQLPAKTYLSDIAGADEKLAGQASTLSGVEVVDDDTVRIRLVRPAANFLVKLAGTPAAVVDSENVAQGEDWWRKPNGSGPFALVEWRDGDRLVLQGHSGYQPQPPTLKTVVILIGAGALQPMNLYERGMIDVASVPASALDRVMAPNNPLNRELSIQPLFSASYILFNPNIPPLTDPDLRRALIQSFDREKVATVSLDGHVKVADGIVPSGLLGRAWTADVPPYDLSAGKDLLRRVAGGSPPAIAIYTGGSWAAVAMKRVYERDLGLPVEVVELELGDLLSDLAADRLPAVALTWVADYPDPDSFLRALFYSTSPDNYIGYDNPEVDRLLDEAAVERDSEHRVQLYQQAQQRIVDDAVVLPLYEDVAYMLVKPGVHGVTLTPLGMLGLESVWITR